MLIGVTGGIAAYKTAALVSRLVQAGADVSVLMTRAATRLVGPKTFEALTGRPVGTGLRPGAHPHIERPAAEVFCVAPATANILAKAACGLADDLLSTTLLSFDGPIIMAPAMNDKMWEKPAVRRNVAQLRADGVVLVDPEEGYLELRRGRRRPDGLAGRIFDIIAQTLKKKGRQRAGGVSLRIMAEGSILIARRPVASPLSSDLWPTDRGHSLRSAFQAL